MTALPYLLNPNPDMIELEKLLERTKGTLFFKPNSAFLSSLCCSHNFVWDSEHPTAWCNGTTVGINPKFFFWLEPEERLTVLAHELWHTGYDHIVRFAELGEHADHDLFNQAADHVINLALANDGFFFGSKLASLQLCIDPKYEGWMTEQVYQDLLRNKPPMPTPQQGAPAGAGTSSPLQDIQLPESGAASAAEIREKILQARNAAERAKEAGDLPGEIQTVINAALYPKLPWETLLFQWFTEISKEDYTWSKPNRRYDDEYLPSLGGEDGLAHLVHFLDVSGSITDEVVAAFNSEVKYIHSVFKPKRMTVISFDTKLQDFYHFDEDTPFDKLSFTGRGGTDLSEVYEYLVRERPTGCVIFTDLHVRPMKADPGIPIVWIVNDNPKAKVPFGRLIHISTK